MNTYARIYDDAVAELFATDGDITQMFNPEMIWVDVTNTVPLPKTGWTAVKKGNAWAFSAPEPSSQDLAQLALAARSQRDALLVNICDRGTLMAQRALRMTTDQDEINLINEKISELDAYATELQAVPQQAGFPVTIDWPTPPTK